MAVRLLTTSLARWLLPNSYVQVQFERAGGQALIVPAEAVVTDDLEAVVFVRQAGRLLRRKVITGSQSQGKIEVLKGLSPGEEIVVKGAILILNEVSL